MRAVLAAALGLALLAGGCFTKDAPAFSRPIEPAAEPDGPAGSTPATPTSEPAPAKTPTPPPVPNAEETERVA